MISHDDELVQQETPFAAVDLLAAAVVNYELVSGIRGEEFGDFAETFGESSWGE